MHIFRIFGVNFGKPARLVFETKPQPAPAEGGGDIKPATPEDLKYAEEAKERHKEGTKTAQEERAKLEAQVRQKELKDKLGEGPAKNYVETFRKFSRTTGFEALTATLEAATELRAGDVPFNFEDWQTLKDQEGIALFIEDGIAIGTFPGGEGSREFLEGLKLNPEGGTPEQVKKIEASNQVLGEMAKILKEHFEAKKDFKKDTAEQAENKPFGMKTIGEGVKTLMKNFKREDGMGKIAILGAVGIGIYLLHRYKDSQCLPFWKEATLSKTLLWLGAGVGINYLSGKVSPDGKTLLQRIDWGKDIEELSDENAMKTFAIKNKMGDNQEKLHTFYKVLNVDVKRLYELYRDAKLNGVATGKNEIDPKQLGFYKGEVDGKSLYEIIENLVQFTAVNEQIRRREEDAKERNIKYVEPSGAEKAEWKANADAAFEEKYFNGPLGNHKQTLFDAIVNEYRTTNYQQVNADYRAQELPQRSYTAAKEGYKTDKEYTIAGLDYIYDTGKTAAKFSWNEMLVPFGSYLKAKYNRYGKPYIDKGIKSARSYLQERDLKKVLPDEFGLNVNEPGKATILDYPNVEFDITTAGGIEKVKIENIEFPIDSGLQGNSQNANKLKKLIEGKVSYLVQEKAKTVPALQGKSVEWNDKEKKWFVKGVDVNGNSLIGLPSTKKDLSIRIEDGNKPPRFYINDTEIDNFNELETRYVDSAVQKEIWEDSRFGRLLKDLPVRVNDINANPPYQSIIKGKIAGLDFSAVLKDTSDITKGINFFDETSQTVGGSEKLIISQNNGGSEFLSALSNKIYKDPYFHEPFMNLYAQIENTDEGIWERVKSAWNTNKWYVIPTDIKGAINGKIAQRLWYYTVQFKMFETLNFFEDAHALKDATSLYTLADIKTDYSKYIESAHKQAQELSRYISSLTPEETAEEFGDLLSNKNKTTKNVRGKNIQIPQGLEYINYGNSEYEGLFKKYKDVISSYKYDFEGLDDLDPSIGAGADSWGVSDKAYDMHLTLLRVWSRHTRQYANGEIDPLTGKANPLSQKTKNYIEFGVIEKIKNLLERTQTSGGGVIKKENLPKSDTEDDLDDWIK